MRNKVWMIVILFLFLLCDNILEYSLSALGMAGGIFILCSEVALLGALILIGYLDDRDNLERSKGYRVMNLVFGPVFLLAYFVYQGWTVVDFINRFGSLN